MRAQAELQMKLREQWVRAVVREEIVNALGALVREAQSQNSPYETDREDSNVFNLITWVAEGAVQRLTCEHEYRFGQAKCWNCDEPEPRAVNPFKEQDR